ncbi:MULTISPECIES: hypothetical protein [Enterobacter]
MNCIIHTHPTHVSALSMLEVPLQISHNRCRRTQASRRW